MDILTYQEKFPGCTKCSNYVKVLDYCACGFPNPRKCALYHKGEYVITLKDLNGKHFALDKYGKPLHFNQKEEVFLYLSGKTVPEGIAIEYCEDSDLKDILNSTWNQHTELS